jgi:hypothetical protein
MNIGKCFGIDTMSMQVWKCWYFSFGYVLACWSRHLMTRLTRLKTKRALWWKLSGANVSPSYCCLGQLTAYRYAVSTVYVILDLNPSISSLTWVWTQSVTQLGAHKFLVANKEFVTPNIWALSWVTGLIYCDWLLMEHCRRDIGVG